MCEIHGLDRALHATKFKQNAIKQTKTPKINRKNTDEKYETNTRLDSLKATKTKVFHAVACKASKSKLPMTNSVFFVRVSPPRIEN